MAGFAQVNWTGTASNNWFTFGNWSLIVLNVNIVRDATIDATANNPVRISGSAASAGSLEVGVSSNPSTVSLRIEAGGSLSLGDGSITLGVDLGSTGTLTVTGSGSTVTSPNGLKIGNRDVGTLTIADGAVVTAGSAFNYDTSVGFLTGFRHLVSRGNNGQ